ncbi:MAG: hypothetical protein ABWK05_06830 [Pyrobaculum sp.]
MKEKYTKLSYVVDPLTLLLILIVFFAAWYSAANLAFRFINKKTAQRCGCEVVKYAGEPSSLLVDLQCPEGRLGLFIKRAPWDNPLNLLFFYATGRKPYVVVRLASPRDLGASDASRRGKGRRAGAYYVVNNSTPREVLEQLLKFGEEVGAWRITTYGKVVQVMWRGSDCGKAVEAGRRALRLLNNAY